MIYLITDNGKGRIGPYDKEREPFEIQRGTRQLRADHPGCEIWAIEADTLHDALQKHRQEKAKK